MVSRAFPQARSRTPGDGVEMKVEDGSLRIRSSRIAARYIWREHKPIADADGFVDTGDMLELRGERYYFVGRRDGVINVGGLKVHPEEVEAVINRHPRRSDVAGPCEKSPLTGALVVADVVLKDGRSQKRARRTTQSVKSCSSAAKRLPRHKVPAAIRFVSALPVAATGKLVRRHA